MVKVIWTEPALKDLHDIIIRIAEDSPVYAERFGIRVVEAPRRLEQFSYCGRIVPEFRDEKIRELIYGAYRIIYLIRSDICYITAVIHGSRDILRHLKPGEWDVT
ncbi:MAG TPA: type II toxin-antitoxin system RelE/ParE family toxin [Nitrospirae bacterium]|nr:plasmid stabilization system protein [bacterium BMS3Abin06]HDH12297.1 type II toxin-antitoxin system RelE/ParE family toxin [Nitrospirota bacterium]HDZ00804.1 type II toxin-antitoxin system RelE/ParE family toxin [Nitrospirota bacterium]